MATIRSFMTGMHKSAHPFRSKLSPLWISRTSAAPSCSISRMFAAAGASSKDDAVYLHVGPSGDFWTGHSIFAAKHLQPDYVKSVKLPAAVDVDHALDLLEDNDGTWCQLIYDNEAIPDDMMAMILPASSSTSSSTATPTGDLDDTNR